MLTNLYSITRLDRSTRGVENTKLKYDERSPKFYEYADTHTDALKQFHKRHELEPTFCAWAIEEENVRRPFSE